MKRTRLRLLALAVSAAWFTGDAQAGWPFKRQAAATETVVVQRPVYARPTAMVTPNGVTDMPGLGTFYATPDALVMTGRGRSYTPFGAYGDPAALAVYGPTSQFRPKVAESVVYERSYGGTLRPTATATVFTYPSLDPRARTSNIYRLPDATLPLRVRQQMGAQRRPFVNGEY